RILNAGAADAPDVGDALAPCPIVAGLSAAAVAEERAPGIVVRGLRETGARNGHEPEAREGREGAAHRRLRRLGWRGLSKTVPAFQQLWLPTGCAGWRLGADSTDNQRKIGVAGEL